MKKEMIYTLLCYSKWVIIMHCIYVFDYKPSKGRTKRIRNNQNRMFKDMLSGCFAGVCGTLLGYPLDTVKTRLQTSPVKASIGEIVQIIYKENGIRTFYRGIESPLVALTILNTLVKRILPLS